MVLGWKAPRAGLRKAELARRAPLGADHQSHPQWQQQGVACKQTYFFNMIPVMMGVG